MLLQNILSGIEVSPLVLIHDDVETCGRDLSSRFVQSLLRRVDCLVAILYDLPPNKFLGFVDEDVRNRIHCCDGFTDPLQWGTERNDCGLIYRDTNVVELVKSSVAERTLNVASPGEQKKVGIVIDSLSKLLLWHPTPATSRSLHQLSSLNTSGFQVLQVVCLVHSDLHDQHTLECINSLASSVLSVSLDSVSCTSEHISCCCKVLHKRKSGKILRKIQPYNITKQGGFSLNFPEKDWTKNSQESLVKEEKEVDPTSNLSFNLKLSEEERTARAELSLPYMFHEKPKNAAQGNIFYQPDDADDFDEEDPDNDLDI